MRKNTVAFSCGLALVLFLFFNGTSSATTYVVEPLLVAQPVYAGMTFYVYRPYNMPSGWFVTFDGYPVSRSAAGVWVYGAYNGTALTHTSYVVGSIHPNALPIVQYVSPAYVSSTRHLPVTPLQPLQPVQGTPAPLEPAAPSTLVTTVPPTYVPGWAILPAFTSIGSWQRLVDRMGILENPRVPIAWKGHRPEALFVWTGRSWFQIQARPGSDKNPSEMIKNHLYSITRMVHNNAFVWNDADTAILAHQAAVWGYLWMGRIAPSNL